MGFFKKLFGDAADELKKNLEDAKKEMLSNLEEVKQDVKAGFTNSTSNSRDDDEENDEEPKILLGDFHDGVLTIREGITELDDESLEHYKRIRKITFPASLERLDSNVIDEQERLEELDFSKVTKLKTIPDDFISGENKVRKLIIPNGVTEVGDGFLGEAKSGAEIFVPASVRKLGYITGNNDNDMTVYLFAANIDISDVEEDVKTLYVLPQYYGWYAKALKKCDSEARLREMPEEMMGVYGATSLGELKEIAKDNASIIAKTDEIQASQLKAKQKQELQKKKEPHKVRVSFNINGDEGFTRITMYPLIGKECQQALKNGVEHDRRTGALEVSQDSIDKLSELLTEKNEQLPLEFLFAHVCTPTELIVTDEESDEEIYNDEYEINPRYGIMSMDEAVDNYEDDEEELEKFKKYLTDTVHIPDDNYISIGIAKTWDKLPESYIEGEGFVPSVIGETLRVASEDDIALLHGETGLSDSTITFNMEIEDEFDPDKLDFINFDAEYGDVSSVLQETLAADFVSMNAIMYDGKMYFAQPQDMDFGDNEGDDYYDIINHHLEGDQKIDIEPESEPKSDENASLTEDSKTESVDDNITDIVQKIKEKLQALGLSSFILYGNDYEGDREYEEVEQLGDEGLLESSSEYAINYDDSYDGNSSVYTKVRKIEIQESGVTFDIEEIYEDNDGDEESRGFHEAQTIDRILESCNRDTVKRGLENILTYLNDETLKKLNSRTETDAEAKTEPVSGLGQEVEPANESEIETVSEKDPEVVDADNSGVFSARLEAMITAALQDGVLTDKERELLKRRAEKEGEDWDEVEMIIEARLAEKNPVTVPAPESESEPESEPDGEQTENVNDKRYPEEYYKKMKLVDILPFIKRRLSDIESLTLRPRSKIDAFDYLNKLSEIVPETEMSVATFIACAEFYETDGFFDDPEAKIRELLQIEGILQNAEALKNREEQIKDYRRKLMDNLKNAKLSRDDSEQAEIELKEAVEKVKLADISIKEGAKSVEEIEQFVIKGLEKAAAEKAAAEKAAAEKAAAEMQALQIEQMKLQMEEQAKAKEVPALKVDKPISKEYARTNEDKYATSIDIPEGVTIIPDFCFYQCSCLESITLPSTIKQIGKYAFDACSALTSIDIPEGVTIIPNNCFDECSSLESIMLPSTIKQIGEYAFSGCSALTSIDIPEGVTIIPNNCFDECSSLESITLPSTIKQIGESAFSGCSSLTSIDIPEGVTIISNGCFCKCKKLNSVTLPTTIKKIENYAFDECNKLKTISIPNGCERIEELSLDNNIINELFLPPTLCAVDGIDGQNLEAYCFAPHLEDLSPFFENNWIYIYVLPQYLDSYKSQAEAEGQDPSFICTMPEEYLYYYDN